LIKPSITNLCGSSSDPCVAHPTVPGSEPPGVLIGMILNADIYNLDTDAGKGVKVHGKFFETCSAVTD